MCSLNLRFDGIFISRGKLHNLLVAHWQNFKGRPIQICSSLLVPHPHRSRESDFRRPRRCSTRMNAPSLARSPNGWFRELSSSQNKLRAICKPLGKQNSRRRGPLIRTSLYLEGPHLRGGARSEIKDVVL